MASPTGGGGAKEDPKKTLLKITRSEDTVLHIAVSESKKEIVKQLINDVAKGSEQPILAQKNEKGNTPLHLAAALGMVEVCAAMAKKCPALVSDARNNRKETPLFLAAKYGKKGTFFVLQYTIESMSNGPLQQNPTDISYCRRDDGHTILHVAINAEHFVSSFKDRSLNKCYIADEEDPGSVQREQQNQETYDSSNQHVNGSSTQGLFPKYYETCFDIFKVAMKFLLVVLGIGLWRTQEVQKKKRKHIYACQIMNELVSRSSKWEYDEDGKKPENKPVLADQISLLNDTPPIDDDSQLNSSKNSSTTEQPSTYAEQIQVTPILVAARRGVVEIVEKILDNFPLAIHDMDRNGKNIVLLAVEHRQPIWQS